MIPERPTQSGEAAFANQITNVTEAGVYTGSSDEDALPKQIGRYRILGVLGEGGMGIVYQAEQDNPCRSVALKIIRRGFAGVELFRRFELESQVLGRLQHPGIAQIYEAGIANSGSGPQPYFAMELIRGESLLQYADAHRLNTRQRLELIAKVSEAVHHAHQRGIIHRDLKPANILVDESGQPKILDFGLARATDTDAQATRQTDVGQIIGTLTYMSPEQVLADPLELDTRTDVYSLGVILYELLAGCLPYKIGQQTYAAAATIREHDPAPLSRVSRAYKGDIETIVGKALQKDKSRRYASAAAMSADIGRYLNYEPIAARPPSLIYQLQKFVRRYRALVSAVTVLFLVLLVGVFVSLREATQARQAERIALQERDRANAEADTARAVNYFLQNDILGQANPRIQSRLDTTADPNLTVRAALDRAAALVSARFKGRPIVEAAIQQTIGNAYIQLGFFAQGRQHLERALALNRDVFGPESPATLDSMFGVAFGLYRFEHKYAEAEPILQKVLEVRRRVSGENYFATLHTMVLLGDLYRFEGKLSQAEALLVEAIKGFDRLRYYNAWPALDARNDLALVYQRQHRVADAEALFLTVLKHYRVQVGEEHPETLNVSKNLAVLYREQGMYAQAEPLLTKVVEVRRRVLGDEHSETQSAIRDLATLYEYESRYAEAERLRLSSLEIAKRVFGPQDPLTLNTMFSLGYIYQAEGKYSKADVLLTELLQKQRQVMGASHAPINTLLALAALRIEEHRYAQSETFSREAEAGLDKAKSSQWAKSSCEVLLGASLAGQKKYPAAESLLLSGYQGAAQFENSNPLPGLRLHLRKYGSWIVEMYQGWGKPDKAAEWREKLHLTNSAPSLR
ncbi:MAG: serine/threonine protein kinase [Acetobacteraceae bacterium]|nr:serine/threonine protein kinase [Acetobacteraceae bacterium]